MSSSRVVTRLRKCTKNTQRYSEKGLFTNFYKSFFCTRSPKYPLPHPNPSPRAARARSLRSVAPTALAGGAFSLRPCSSALASPRSTRRASHSFVSHNVPTELPPHLTPQPPSPSAPLASPRSARRASERSPKGGYSSLYKCTFVTRSTPN